MGELEKLPGVGPKSAQRLAYHLLRIPDAEAFRLADAIRTAKSSLRFCEICQNVSQEARCEICLDPRRDPAIVCVVAEPRDVTAIERLNEFRGRYHVLHGLLSPLDGIGPDALRVRALLGRLGAAGQEEAEETIRELILATNPTIEGDATALYLAGLVKPIGVKVTRLAQGMAVGGELDYADAATLLSALEYRREM